jgi:hypothetical protein
MSSDVRSAGSTIPERDLEDFLWPYYALHRLWWRRVLDRRGVAGWLATMEQLYHASGATSSLLLTAARRAGELGAGHRPFVEWCEEHAAEEVDHASWLLDDLVTAGVDGDRLAASLPDPQLLRLIGAQYMLAGSVEPTGILGFFFVGECHPTTTDHLVGQAQRFGLPQTAVRTLVFHATEDVEHSADVLAMIRRYSGERQQAAMRLSATEYLAGWTRFFQELVAAPAAVAS